MPEYKRNIREDIAETIGIQESKLTEYSHPGFGDRQFTTEHIGYILQYLDVKKPRKFARYKYHNKLARVVEERTGIAIDGTDTSPQYTGFKKAELETIRDVVEDHEPIGLPSREELADHVMDVLPDVGRDEAEKAADNLLSHLERQSGSNDLRRGFTVEDVEVKRRVRLGVERDKEGHKTYLGA